jgi:hypothetical protein
MGLVFVQARSPSVQPRTRSVLFGLFGAVCGLVAGVLFGVLGIQEVCVSGGIDLECGWSVFGVGLVQRSFWPTFGSLVALGVILGTVGGVTAALLTRGRQAPATAMPEA